MFRFLKIMISLLMFCMASIGIGQQSKIDSDLFATKLIDTLASKTFSGRGYNHNGVNKAADYLVSIFKEIGLEKIGDSYFQSFDMPINIIQDARLKINGKELRYGYDFLVRPSSKSQHFHSNPIYYFDPQDFEAAFDSKDSMIQFIKKDMQAQTGADVIFPAYRFKTDSLNRYYRSWSGFYRPDENRNRVILFFTKDKLTASLSQHQDSISEFIIRSELDQKPIRIDDYRIESRFVSDFKSKNIIGKIPGERHDSVIVITAHYDHLGSVGDVYFPGASDNASGTAFAIDIARHFRQNRPQYDLIFILFAGEEAGLVGSNYFVEHPLFDLSKIKFLINFDIMGSAENGIQIVNSKIFNDQFELLKQINHQKNYVTQIKTRGEACNSDHCPFYKKGVKSIFVYTLGGPGYYHDVYDTADSLPLYDYTDLKHLFIDFIDQL